MKTKSKWFKYRIAVYLILALGIYLAIEYSSFTKTGFLNQYSFRHAPIVNTPSDPDNSFYLALATQAEKRLEVQIRYDGSYRKIAYPMGDVPPNIGVCTDVIIRSYRGMGIDLQEKVHNDMKDNFSAYPKMWRLTSPDTNIDHRRVPNLMIYFNRMGASLPITNNPNDYLPGHIVAWDLGRGLTHIGIVSSQTSQKTNNPLIVHNIGGGPKLEDILFNYKIIGHYRYGATQQITD